MTNSIPGVDTEQFQRLAAQFPKALPESFGSPKAQTWEEIWRMLDELYKATRPVVDMLEHLGNVGEPYVTGELTVILSDIPEVFQHGEEFPGWRALQALHSAVEKASLNAHTIWIASTYGAKYSVKDIALLVASRRQIEDSLSTMALHLDKVVECLLGDCSNEPS